MAELSPRFPKESPVFTKGTLMSTSVWTQASDWSTFSEKALKAAVQLWFAAAVAGQWIFVTYVVIFYGGSALQGNLDAWNKVLPHGHTPGDPLGNTAVAVHLALAVIIMVGGPLQLIPAMRQRFPAFHRASGRVYFVTVLLTSVAGLYMVWSRGRADLVQRFGISLDAFLIVAFALLAVRYAMAGNIRTHRRWALRLFMVVNAGWFFRIGLMQWLFLNRGPVGFDPRTFTGPFLSFLSFADYAVPLAMLELYLHAKDRGGASGRLAMAGALVVLTVGMIIGTFAATMVMWLPHIQGVAR
jgi:uncharacterized membrane protein